MKIDHLQLEDGDILRVPADTTQECLRWLSSAITNLHPDKRIIVLTCPVEKVSELDLAAVGLYRSSPQKTTH